MDAPLAAFFDGKVLDRIRQIDALAIDARGGERGIEHLSGGANEWSTREVFHIARLLADQDQRGRRRPLTEHHLCRGLVQRTAAARRRRTDCKISIDMPPRPGLFAPLLSAHERPSSGFSHLHRETIVPASRHDTFAFFGDASNLERLTPPWLNLAILTPTPVAMWAGVDIDYRISLYGLSMPWRSRIDIWEPPVRFVDRQVVGPYRWWRHEHRFEAVPGGTLVVDHVEYVPRARWVSAALVRRDLERIFTYRQQALRQLFGRDDLGARST